MNTIKNTIIEIAPIAGALVVITICIVWMVKFVKINPILY